MASCFFLLKQFEDVLIYLNSIKVGISYFCIANTPLIPNLLLLLQSTLYVITWIIIVLPLVQLL